MTPYNFETILTLDARSNTLLDVIKDGLNLSDAQMYVEISKMARHLKANLAQKGIAYLDLRRALVPSHDKQERAFVFDWTKVGDNWYGKNIVERLLPGLERTSSRSVLLGDWLARKNFRFADAYLGSQGQIGDGTLKNLPPLDTLYFVYLNNLSRTGADRIDAIFDGTPGYLGAVELSRASLLKAALSTMLVRAFIQHRSVIIQGHPDDAPDHVDENMIGYDFSASGYTVRSVPSWMYGAFLAYKIERPFLRQETDQTFSLNSLSPTFIPLEKCSVTIEERKLEYLRTVKGGSMRRTSFAEMSAAELSDKVKEKLAENYIYNMARAVEGTLKFNIIIEASDGARAMCALEYLPAQAALKILTFY
jgi:hypothetical protein